MGIIYDQNRAHFIKAPSPRCVLIWWKWPKELANNIYLQKPKLSPGCAFCRPSIYSSHNTNMTATNVHRQEIHDESRRNGGEMTVMDLNESIWTIEPGHENKSTHTPAKPEDKREGCMAEIENNRHDWQTVSRILDRGFFILYTTCSICLTCTLVLTMSTKSKDTIMWSPIAETLESMQGM